LYEQITGKKFIKDSSKDIQKRIEGNIIKALEAL
jgi:hypothetical protein